MDYMKMDDIVMCISKQVNVSYRDLLSKKLGAEVKAAKKIAYYVLAKYMNISERDIATYFGCDVVTVMNYISSLESQLDEGDELRGLVLRCRDAIRNG